VADDPQFAKSYAELGAKTDDQLIREHDRILTTGSVGTEYYLNELARRAAERQASVYVHLMDDGLGDALDEATWNGATPGATHATSTQANGEPLASAESVA
jgi:hypothetical protein